MTTSSAVGIGVGMMLGRRFLAAELIIFSAAILIVTFGEQLAASPSVSRYLPGRTVSRCALWAALALVLGRVADGLGFNHLAERFADVAFVLVVVVAIIIGRSLQVSDQGD